MSIDVRIVSDNQIDKAQEIYRGNLPSRPSVGEVVTFYDQINGGHWVKYRICELSHEIELTPNGDCYVLRIHVLWDDEKEDDE